MTHDDRNYRPYVWDKITSSLWTLIPSSVSLFKYAVLLERHNGYNIIDIHRLCKQELVFKMLKGLGVNYK